MGEIDFIGARNIILLILHSNFSNITFVFKWRLRDGFVRVISSVSVLTCPSDLFITAEGQAKF
jgi:hypothetical protein